MKGTLKAAETSLDRAEEILLRRELVFQRAGDSVAVEHSDRNMNPGDHRVNKALRELASVFDEPQRLILWDEFRGEHEVVVGKGRVKQEETENIWSSKSDIPSPEEIVILLRDRGVSARLAKVKGRRGGARTYEFQPGAGGACCKVTVKRRFWDSFDLLSVPAVSNELCQRYEMDSERLREKLHASTFGLEVRNPASGGLDTDELYTSLLEVLEDLTEGIRTTVG